LANSACVSVTCSSTGIMSATLRPDVFGILDTDLPLFQNGTEKLTFNDDSCPINLNSVSNRFEISGTVTDCGNVAYDVDP